MAFIDITKSTTVGNLNDTIKALEEAKKKALSSAERERLQQFITRYSTTKDKLISICKKDIKEHQMYIDPEVKLEADKLTRDGFRALSLESWTKVVQLHNNSSKGGLKDPSRVASAPTMKDIEFNNHGEGFMNFLEGKSGLTLMTSVKASLTTMALAGLHTIGAFNIVPALLTTLWAINPVIAFAAGALAVTGAAMLIKKVFGKELSVWKNAIKTNIIGKKSIDGYMSKSDHIDLEAEAREQEKIGKKEADEVVEEEKKDNLTYDKEFEGKLKDLIGQNIPNLAAEVDKLKKEYAPKGKFDPRTIDKIVEEVFSSDLINRAVALATSTKRENTTEIQKLRDLYAGVLDSALIDKILTDNSLTIEKPNLTNIANEVIAGGEAHKKGYEASTASTAYREFKAAYDALIVKITSGTHDSREINKDIADLVKYSKKDAFLVAFTPGNPGDPNSWTIDDKKAAKIATLCSGMIEILRELATQLAHGESSLDAKKAQKDHGLTDQQLQEIEDLMKK